MEAIKVFVGFDAREAVAYHVCCQSLIEHSSMPLEITPLALDTLKHLYAECHNDGSNAFIYSRFLVPFLCGFKGHAIYLDGDMILRRDIAELYGHRRFDQGVQVVQHDYKTKHKTKYLGAKNEDYPRKNWSSLILWNCDFYPNRVLTPEFVNKQKGSFLHRFQWLADERIGELHPDWNHLTMEYERNPQAALYHYTLGTPCFPGYDKQEGATEWYATFLAAIKPVKAN